MANELACASPPFLPRSACENERPLSDTNNFAASNRLTPGCAVMQDTNEQQSSLASLILRADKQTARKHCPHAALPCTNAVVIDVQRHREGVQTEYYETQPLSNRPAKTFIPLLHPADNLSVYLAYS